MKIILKILYVFIITTVIVSCNTNKEKRIEPSQKEEKKELVQDVKNIEVEITGMTCEIGCARLIQSKLYKTDGITFANVSFEDSNGKITYDANQISNKKIKEIIENIAGGDLYKVGEIDEVEEFSHDKNNVSL
jgi:Cu+-exporting ATPase